MPRPGQPAWGRWDGGTHLSPLLHPLPCISQIKSEFGGFPNLHSAGTERIIVDG